MNMINHENIINVRKTTRSDVLSTILEHERLNKENMSYEQYFITYYQTEKNNEIVLNEMFD